MKDILPASLSGLQIVVTMLDERYVSLWPLLSDQASIANIPVGLWPEAHWSY